MVKLKYKTAIMRDADKQIIPDKRRPFIVGVRNYSLDELVKFALSGNYIEGAKYELAKGIVKGIIEAERDLVLAGNSVSVDGWVKYEPRLKGSVLDSEKRVLNTGRNQLITGVSALKELRMELADFSWQCVDEDMKPTPTPEPLITGGHSEGHAAEDQLIHGGVAYVLEGENLADASVKLTYMEGGAEKNVDVPAAQVAVTPGTVTVAWDAIRPALDAAAETVTFTVTTPGGTATYVGESSNE